MFRFWPKTMHYSKGFRSMSLCTHNSSLGGAMKLKIGQGDAKLPFLIQAHTSCTCFITYFNELGKCVHTQTQCVSVYCTC